MQYRALFVFSGAFCAALAWSQSGTSNVKLSSEPEFKSWKIQGQIGPQFPLWSDGDGANVLGDATLKAKVTLSYYYVRGSDKNSLNLAVRRNTSPQGFISDKPIAIVASQSTAIYAGPLFGDAGLELESFIEYSQNDQDSDRSVFGGFEVAGTHQLRKNLAWKSTGGVKFGGNTHSSASDPSVQTVLTGSTKLTLNLHDDPDPISYNFKPSVYIAAVGYYRPQLSGLKTAGDLQLGFDLGYGPYSFTLAAANGSEDGSFKPRTAVTASLLYKIGFSF